ncbi:MAG: glutathione S-transferase family protein [Pseudolabrys sp.]|nr:glutathione S-transferase family protein [Pseudolabrys sp.]
MSSADTFVLRSTLTSPFGRKVRMAIDLLGLGERIVIVPADTLDQNDTLRQQNPLGKLPCLIAADGTAIYGSGVIVEFLQELAGGALLAPARGLERYKALTKATLADGIADAALLIVYERRFRDPGTYSERWLQHQRGKIARALTAFGRDLPDPAKTDLVSIALACALGYLDWRKPVPWRDDHPGVAAWLADFSKHEPLYARTRAPEP